jgi:hypothetical protein
MTVLGTARSFGSMNPIALIEAAAATRRMVLGALAKPQPPRR